MLFDRNFISARSYAKINLALQITGTREDGYHYLRMVNLPIDLHDVIEINRDRTNSDVFITCDDIGLSNAKRNLCHKAVDALRQECKFKDGFTIAIHKDIPFAAGLGGGSSNAAAVLTSLNTMLKLGLSDEKLAEIGLTIGADVPFFFRNKPSYVTGIGEKIEEIPVKKDYFCVIAKPDKGLSTMEIYGKCDNYARKNINIDGVLEGLAKGDDQLIIDSMGNDLEEAAISLCPEIAELIRLFKESGFGIAGMSGSGSSVFGLTTDLKKARDLERMLEKHDYTARLCKVLK